MRPTIIPDSYRVLGCMSPRILAVECQQWTRGEGVRGQGASLGREAWLPHPHVLTAGWSPQRDLYTAKVHSVSCSSCSTTRLQSIHALAGVNVQVITPECISAFQL